MYCLDIMFPELDNENVHFARMESFEIYWAIVSLRGHNCVHFAHRPQCTVTLNSKFAILKT